MRVMTMVEMDYTELERLVAETWPAQKYWSFEADQEIGAGDSRRFTVEPINGGDPQHAWEIKEWIEFINGRGPSWMSRKILHHLCFMGKIPAGEYVIINRM